MPVDSMTTSAPTSPHFSSAGSFTAVRRIFLPFTTSVLPSTATVAVEAAVHRVVLEHVGQVVGLEQVVDGDHFNVLEVGHGGTEHHAPDAAEAVDADLDGHVYLLECDR